MEVQVQVFLKTQKPRVEKVQWNRFESIRTSSKIAIGSGSAERIQGIHLGPVGPIHLLGPVGPIHLLGPVGPIHLLGPVGPFICWALLGPFIFSHFS